MHTWLSLLNTFWPFQPVLLPKPPVVNQTPVNSNVAKPTMAIKVIKPHQQQQTQFLVTSAASSMIPGKKLSNSAAPAGSSQNPIQLIQEGTTLRSLHPLTNTQVTQIAKALKEKTQNDVPSAVVCENGPNSTRFAILYKYTKFLRWQS